jgi:phosphatidylglycerophosphate synthase
MPAATVVGRRIPPMVVTVAAFVFGLGAAVAAARGANGTGLALWLANRVLDGFDGTLARAQGAQSDIGGYVDIVLDFVIYAAVPLGLVLGAAPPERATLAVSALVMLASFYVNAASWMYLAAILERRGAGAAARGELTTITMRLGWRHRDSGVLRPVPGVAANSGAPVHTHDRPRPGHGDAAACLGGAPPLIVGIRYASAVPATWGRTHAAVRYMTQNCSAASVQRRAIRKPAFATSRSNASRSYL